MKRRAAHVALVVLLIAFCVAGLRFYYQALDAENTRLRSLVEKHFQSVTIPLGSTLIYQEVISDRVCKTATITELFSTELPTEDVCAAVYSSLKAEGWKSHDGCRAQTYPFKRVPIYENRPSYNYHNLVADEPLSKFRVTLSAKPKDAWGPLFMLSSLGEAQAVPLARKNGETFFTVKVFYIEDQRVFEKHCPQSMSHCDCADTLFAWKFSNGRQFSRSW